MRKAGTIQCECGCKEFGYLAQMKKIELEVAVDESLRDTKIGRRYYVIKEHEKDFIHELQAQQVLAGIVTRYKSKRSSVFTRLMRVRGVMRLQHTINIRTLGPQRTVRKVKRTGILFLSPHWLAGWLDLYFRRKDQKHAAKLRHKRLMQRPATVKEAVEKLIEELTEQDREFIRRNDSGTVHFTKGMSMRNKWGLWEKDSPIKRDAIENYKIAHADDISGLILAWVWALVREEPFNPQAYCQRFHDHWRNAGTTSLEAGGVK